MKSNLAIRYKLVDVYNFNNSYLIYILYLVILNVFQLEYITKAASFKLINYLSIYASSTFQKYINNNGPLSHNQDIGKQRKAESLTHFSFVK